MPPARHSVYTKKGFPEDRLRALLSSPDTKRILLRNGLKDELLAFLPPIEGNKWRFSKTSDPQLSSIAYNILHEIGEAYWDQVFDYHFLRVNRSTMPHLILDTTPLGPLNTKSTDMSETQTQIDVLNTNAGDVAVPTTLLDSDLHHILPSDLRHFLEETITDGLYRF